MCYLNSLLINFKQYDSNLKEHNHYFNTCPLHQQYEVKSYPAYFLIKLKPSNHVLFVDKIITNKLFIFLTVHIFTSDPLYILQTAQELITLAVHKIEQQQPLQG